MDSSSFCGHNLQCQTGDRIQIGGERLAVPGAEPPAEWNPAGKRVNHEGRLSAVGGPDQAVGHRKVSRMRRHIPVGKVGDEVD